MAQAMAAEPSLFQSDWLLEAAASLRKSGLKSRSQEFIGLAATSIAGMSDRKKRGAAEVKLVHALAMNGDLDDADVVAAHIADEQARLAALIGLAIHRGRSGDRARGAQLLVEAEEIAEKSSQQERESGLARIADASTELGSFATAERLISKQPAGYTRGLSHSKLALAFFEARQGESVLRIVRLAQKDVMATAQRQFRNDLLLRVARILAMLGRTEEAATELSQVETLDIPYSSDSGNRLAATLGDLNLIGELEKLMAKILEPRVRDQLAAEGAIGLARHNSYRNARSLIVSHSAPERIRVYSEIMRRCGTLGLLGCRRPLG